MKKLISIALSMALLMSSMFCLTVSADEDSPTTGSITLTKYDSSKDILTEGGKAVGGTSVEGAIFSAYKVLDLNGSAEDRNYTINSAFKADDGTKAFELKDVIYKTDSDGNATNGALSYGTTTALEKQISDMQRWIKDKSVPATAVKTTNQNGVATFEELSFGVYLIVETSAPDGYVINTDSFLAAVPEWNNSTQEWNCDVKAIPKNQSIQVSKELTKSGSTTEKAKSDSYSIGDTIRYTITATIPNYGMSAENSNKTVTQNLLATDDGVTKYNALNLIFEDTFSTGLTFNSGSLTVTADGTELTKGDTLKEGYKTGLSSTPVLGAGDYTASIEGQKLTVTVSWAALDSYQGKDIVLTYNATLNENAAVGTANTNTVTYKYKNSPNATDPQTKTDADNVYTYQFDLTKTFNGLSATDAGVDPKSVIFEFYNGDGSYINLIRTADGEYTVWNGSTTGKTTTDISPKADGTISIKGLKAGQYLLQETNSTDGYTKIIQPIQIWVYEVEESDALTARVKAHTMKYDEAAQQYVEDTDTDLAVGDSKIGVFALTVNNSKAQFNLPITGGIGLLLFTAGGGAVMVLAVILLTYSKRKKSEK